MGNRGNLLYKKNHKILYKSYNSRSYALHMFDFFFNFCDTAFKILSNSNIWITLKKHN